MATSDVKNVVINASLLPTPSRRATRKSILPEAVGRKKSMKQENDVVAPSAPKNPVIVVAPVAPKKPVVVVGPAAVAAPAVSPKKSVVVVGPAVSVKKPIQAPLPQKGIIVGLPPAKPVVVVGQKKTPVRKTVVQVIDTKPKKTKLVPKTLKKTDSIVVPVVHAAPVIQKRKTLKHTPTKQRSIKLSTTAKRKRDAVEKIKSDIEVVPIQTVKDKLVKEGLITAHSRAPEEVLRDMYKNHTLASGVILVTRPVAGTN